MMADRTRVVPLANGRGEAIIDEDDAELVARLAWQLHDRGYAVSGRGTGGRTGSPVYLHRLIMGAEPGQVVDHINGDKLDCRRVNLRVGTQATNTYNRRTLRANGHSRFKGVSWDGAANRWQANIHAGRQFNLGRYATEEEAARAYDTASLRLHGEWGATNVDLGLLPPLGQAS